MKLMKNVIILDSAVRSRFLAQAFDARCKFKKRLITNKVTTPFLNSLCTSKSCTIKPNPTADTRIINGHDKIRMQKLDFCVVLIICTFLVACASKPTDPKETNHKTSLQKKGIPKDVSNALIPPLNIPIPETSSVPLGRRFDVSVNDAEAREVYLNLVRDTNYNVIVDPSIKGNVTLSLKNVTLDDVFAYLHKSYGHNYEKNGSQYIVYGHVIKSKLFHVNYINMVRGGTSTSTVSSGGLGAGGNSGVNIQTKNDVSFWAELSQSLTALLGDKDENKRVVVNRQSGFVIVSAYPNELKMVEQFLSGLQSSITRQVILEAKLLEVELNEGFQTGINWTSVFNSGSKQISGGFTGGGTALRTDGLSENAGNSTSNLVSNPISALEASSFGGVFGVAVNVKYFGAFIELMKSQGKVQVLSSPRIAAMNNQKAVIKVGGEEFFVTGVEAGEKSANENGTSTSSPPKVEVQSFFSGIALDVTPQIDDQGNIMLHLHPTVSDVTQSNKSFVIGGDGYELPLAASSVRETDTIVRAKEGQIIVVGGLMKESVVKKTVGIPILSELPFFGALFRHDSEVKVKKELVVLVKPTLANKNGQWNTEMQFSLQKEFEKM